jgi:hypothetical protein
MGIIEAIITILSRFVIGTISAWGYTGILVTMAIESACIPLPSEIIMPFSGYLVTTGQFTMVGVTLAGALGNVVGSILAYYAGVWGGRPFVERYGPYMLLSHRPLVLKIRRSGRLLQPYAAGRADIHFIARRHRPHEFSPLCDLHVHRLDSVVLFPRLCWSENGRTVGTTA